VFMNASGWAIAVLSFIAGALTIIVAQQAIRLAAAPPVLQTRIPTPAIASPLSKQSAPSPLTGAASPTSTPPVSSPSIQPVPSPSAQAGPPPSRQPTKADPPELFPEANRACTLKAAEDLPKIAGLVVKNTRTMVLSRPANWKDQTPPFRVEMDIAATGQIETYSYVCIYSSVGALVQRVAN
jgi:hypothetical protein